MICPIRFGPYRKERKESAKDLGRVTHSKMSVGYLTRRIVRSFALLVTNITSAS